MRSQDHVDVDVSGSMTRCQRRGTPAQDCTYVSSRGGANIVCLCQKERHFRKRHADPRWLHVGRERRLRSTIPTSAGCLQAARNSARPILPERAMHTLRVMPAWRKRIKDQYMNPVSAGRHAPLPRNPPPRCDCVCWRGKRFRRVPRCDPRTRAESRGCVSRQVESSFQSRSFARCTHGGARPPQLIRSHYLAAGIGHHRRYLIRAAQRSGPVSPARCSPSA